MRCPHPEDRIEVRKFPRMGKPAGFKRQCLECFEEMDSRWLDRRDLPGGVHPGHVLMARIDVHKKRGSTGLGGDGNSKRAAYRKFMGSAAWKRQRERVLARDGDVCRDCGGHATEAAHIRYADPIEKTPDRDIKSSCRDCNSEEKSQRIASTGGKPQWSKRL